MRTQREAARNHPLARRSAELRQVAIEQATREDVILILAVIKEQALKGNLSAARLWLSYSLAKPGAVEMDPHDAGDSPPDPHGHACIGDCPVMQQKALRDSPSEPQKQRQSVPKSVAPPSANGDLGEQETASSESRARSLIWEGVGSGSCVPGPTASRGGMANLQAQLLPSSDPQCHPSIGDRLETLPSASKDSAGEHQNQSHTMPKSVAPPSTNGDFSEEEAVEKEVKTRRFAILGQRIKEARPSLGLPPLSPPDDPQCHLSIGDCPDASPSALKDKTNTLHDERPMTPQDDTPPSPNGDFEDGEDGNLTEDDYKKMEEVTAVLKQMVALQRAHVLASLPPPPAA